MNAARHLAPALVTSDFSVLLDLAAYFGAKHLDFLTFTPGDPIPASVGVVVTTAAEADKIDHHTIIIASTPRGTYEQVHRCLSGPVHVRTLAIGIDPGERPGFAVLGDGRVFASRQLPATEVVAAAVARAIRLHPADRVLVRVGHGAATKRDQIINALLDAGHVVEEVDETATSHARGASRAQRDAAAARSIALIPGRPVTRRRKLWVPHGEVRDLQRRSRELSGGDVTIPKHLAVEVARGRMTLAEAIALVRPEVV